MTEPQLQPAGEIPLQREWPRYYDAVKGDPRDTLLRALEQFDAEPAPDEPRSAVDLACGEGRDTAELICRGWRVLAIDGHPEGLRRLRARPDLEDHPRLSVVQAMMEDAEIPVSDLVVASFALPFCRPSRFAELWGRILAGIRPGGRFCGQFFGDRDSWAEIPDRTHHTRAEVDRLLAPLEIEHFEEAEKDGTDALGAPKHWHVFHIVGRMNGIGAERP